MLTLIGISAMVGLVGVALKAAGGEGKSAPAGGPATRPAGKMQLSRSGYDLKPLPPQRIQELAKGLTDEERRILLDKDTERPFCGLLLDNKEEGVYVCRLCSLPLFSSLSKFQSGTGWPSFFQPYDTDHIREQRDLSHGMMRVEILCKRCGSHLGHVFNDGPKPTGLRYCLNSGALTFHKADAELPAEARPTGPQTAYFAGGCFWGIEDHLQQIPGVIDAVSGYQGGTVPKPSYKLVCTGRTGHAESVRVTFDPNKVTYRALLEWFFKLHDPTQLNRQGPDVGTQYRSAIFTVNDDQLKRAHAYVQELQSSPRFQGRQIVTRIERAGPFFEAEDYHQDYHAKHGGSCPLPTQ